MRSRYSAFATENEAYLLLSWHSSTRPSRVRLRGDDEWLGLEILATDRGGALDADGTVDFRATVRRSGALETLREVSRFEREKGRWVYLDGRYPLG